MINLNSQLLLFHYILHQLGYKDFEALRDEFSNKQFGANNEGTSFFASTLLANANRGLSEKEIYEYDEAIQGYENKLRTNRAESSFTFKYYQWLSLFFTEYFFDQYTNQQDSFIDDLDKFRLSNKEFNNIKPVTKNDLKKIAYWMATGSGKTLLMHCNYWQAQKYFDDWENMILITPNEGLSQQHYEELTKSKIPCKKYSGSEESSITKSGEILIIEMTKLVEEKEGEGVTISVDAFSEYRNLVFIDEGHKGQKSEEQKWKQLRDYLTRSDNSFTFEYSATFGQVITGKNHFLYNEYGKSIIFDYSYRHFYTDGYGKDFSVFNLDVQTDYSDKEKDLLLTASLMGFYEQTVLYENNKQEMRRYNIEKPLWIFVGSRVVGAGSQLTQRDKASISDVSQIIEFAADILANPVKLKANLDKILDENSGLTDENGDDIFKAKFSYLKQNQPLAEDILYKIFHGVGSLEVHQIKQAEGEIALKTKTSKNYFAVINIGDVSRYLKKLQEDTKETLAITEDNFTPSLFQNLSNDSSSINILIGSKKFIEGWSSWRVSTMGLMNMGKGEGAQIIQLFGRGVRLKGKDYSLKREDENAPYHIRALQTISIMGLNASYMNRFLEEIEKDIPEFTHYPIDIQFNQPDKWNGEIITFRKEHGKQFKNETIELTYNYEIAKRVNIDLRNKISISSSEFKHEVAEDSEPVSNNILSNYIKFIDFQDVSLEINRFKLLKGFTNLIISSGSLYSIIEQGGYNVISHENQFTLKDAVEGKIQKIAKSVLKDYIAKYYAEKEKDFLTRNLTYDMLEKEQNKDMFPDNDRIIVKIPRKKQKQEAKPFEDLLEELKKNIQELYKADSDILPSLHLDEHLYSPLVIYGGNRKKFSEVKTIPARLNKGETEFVQHLKEYVRASRKLSQYQIYLLRNISKKGLGFYMESSMFFPDFIIWAKKDKKQHLFFIDPKGIMHGETNFSNPKVKWCRDDVIELERKIQDDLKTEGKSQEVYISAYILSISKIEEVRKIWSDKYVTKDEFKNNHVLFLEDNPNYLDEVFQDL